MISFPVRLHRSVSLPYPYDRSLAALTRSMLAEAMRSEVLRELPLFSLLRAASTGPAPLARWHARHGVDYKRSRMNTHVTLIEPEADCMEE